jgi:hypothetical protein
MAHWNDGVRHSSELGSLGWCFGIATRPVLFRGWFSSGANLVDGRFWSRKSYVCQNADRVIKGLPAKIAEVIAEHAHAHEVPAWTHPIRVLATRDLTLPRTVAHLQRCPFQAGNKVEKS